MPKTDLFLLFMHPLNRAGIHNVVGGNRAAVLGELV